MSQKFRMLGLFVAPNESEPLMASPTDADLTNKPLSGEPTGFDALQEIGSWLCAAASAREKPEQTLYDELELKLYHARPRPNSTYAFQRAGAMLRALALTPQHKRFLPAKAQTVLTDLLQLGGMPGSFRQGTLTFIAGAASAERTQLLVDFAIQAAERDMATAFFSMGTSTNHLVRMVSARGLDPLSEQGRIETAHRLGDAPLYVDDSSALDICEIRGRARRLARHEGRLATVVIDSLTQMIGNSSPQAMEYLADSLKHLSKELRCNIVACIDLPEGSKPSLDGLRTFGNMDQAADAILFTSDTSDIEAVVAESAS